MKIGKDFLDIQYAAGYVRHVLYIAAIKDNKCSFKRMRGSGWFHEKDKMVAYFAGFHSYTKTRTNYP